MTTTNIILSVSITTNIFLLLIILILWFRKCKECGRDKEIGRIFSKNCEKCDKKENGNGNSHKTYTKL